MANATQNNIEKKRQSLKRRRRRKFFRAIFACVLTALIGTAILFIGINVYNGVGHIYNEFSEMYAGYNERRAARIGEIDPKFEGYTNILILGVDTGKSRLISIPRDTWVSADSSAGRIGTLYSWGGASLIVRHVSALLGIAIHQYVVIDMTTFADLIDVFGGIDIYVEEDMNYEDPESGLEIHLGQGYQHLDGNDAQKYLRFRSEKLGDVGRVQRQQKFFKAFYTKVLQLDTIPKLPAIADIFRNRMETSAEIFDSAHLANIVRQMSSDPPSTVMLPGSENEHGMWIPDLQGIDARIKELFPVQDIAEEPIIEEEPVIEEEE